ncbi:MAG: hypothetical protein ACK53T_09605 [Planctomycetota bacterium]
MTPFRQLPRSLRPQPSARASRAQQLGRGHRLHVQKAVLALLMR